MQHQVIGCFRASGVRGANDVCITKSLAPRRADGPTQVRPGVCIQHQDIGCACLPDDSAQKPPCMPSEGGFAFWGLGDQERGLIKAVLGRLPA
jgi:hypothetical protein